MSKDQPNVQNISVNLIDPPEFNSRTDRQGPAKTQAEQKFQQLLSSMEADGQLQAIEVEGPNDAGRYLLNLGSRRLRAAIDLDWPTIRAEVRPYSDARTRILRNFKENLIRDDLTQFEMSRALLKLRDGGLTSVEAAKELGFSKQKASTLAVASQNPSELIYQWEAGNEAATTDFMAELGRMGNPQKQLAAFKEREEEIKSAKAAAKPKPGRSSKAKKSAAKGYPLNQHAMDVCVTFLKSSKCPDKIGGTKKWAVTLLDYLLGGRTSPPDGIDEPTTKTGKK